MGAWVHEQTVTQHAGTVVCGACYIDNRSPCTTPEPDAASPCGYDGCWLSSRDCHCDDPAEGCKNDHPITSDAHPHIATLCLNCHHGIRRAEGGA